MHLTFAHDASIGGQRRRGSQLLNRQIFYNHTLLHLRELLTLFGLVESCLHSRICSRAAPWQNSVLAGNYGLLPLLRWLIQFFVYDRRLWKGNRFNTTMHVVFASLWTYFCGCLRFSLVASNSQSICIIASSWQAAAVFFGTALARTFTQAGNEVIVLTRSPQNRIDGAKEAPWDAKNLGEVGGPLVDGADAVINLTGKSVDCRYTEKNHRAIIASRVELDASSRPGRCALLRKPPRIWLNASSATIYKHQFRLRRG